MSIRRNGGDSRAEPTKNASGSPALTGPLRSCLDSTARKGYRIGTHRLVAPEKTIERLRSRLPEMGITRVANITGLDRIGIPVVMVCRPNSRSLAVSQGKGLTLEAARASGLMESVEAYHAERIELPREFATWGEQQKTRATVDLSKLPRTSRQGFDHDTSLWWMKGVELLSGESLWLPFELVSLDFRVPAPEGSGWFLASSNGLASGNHLLEAISHAICEVIERDAFSLWCLKTFPQAAATKLILEGIEDPAVRLLLDKFRRAEVRVAVWEITSDIGVPCFFSTIIDRRDRGGGMYAASGFGCHPSCDIALLRALTEAAQSRLTAISGARDDLPRETYLQQRAPSVLRRQRQLVEGCEPRRRFDLVPSHQSDSFMGDISWLLERLLSVGLDQVVLVDLTAAEIGIPVVRVIIPGLEAACVSRGDFRLGARGRAVTGSAR
ncbi:MAG: YcaO-like family protein [bacterium]|nr:YcaO-like family protein [bacterium]